MKRNIIAAMIMAATVTATAACGTAQTAAPAASSSTSASKPKTVVNLLEGMDQARAAEAPKDAAFVWSSRPCRGLLMRTPSGAIFRVNVDVWRWGDNTTTVGSTGTPIKPGDCTRYVEDDEPGSLRPPPARSVPVYGVYSIPFAQHAADSAHANGDLYSWLYVPEDGEPLAMFMAGNYQHWSMPYRLLLCGTYAASGVVAPASPRLGAFGGAYIGEPQGLQINRVQMSCVR